MSRKKSSLPAVVCYFDAANPSKPDCWGVLNLPETLPKESNSLPFYNNNRSRDNPVESGPWSLLELFIQDPNSALQDYGILKEAMSNIRIQHTVTM